MKICVTGGTGFIGYHLCLNLLKLKHDVHILARDPGKTQMLIRNGAKIIEGDLADTIDYENFFSDCDVLFHVASLLGPQGLPYKMFYQVNVGGTKKIVSVALRMKVPKIIHFSSVGVLGSVSANPVTEDAPCNPGDAYEKTKYEAEQWVLQQSLFHQGIVIIRPAWVFGPGDRRTLKLFRALQKGRFFFIGNGNGLQHPVYIDDLIDGCMLAMEKSVKSGEIFHLGGNEIVSIKNLIEQICKLLDVKIPKFNLPYYPMNLTGKICEILAGLLRIDPPLSVAKVDFFTKNRSYSIEKAKKILAYNPKVSLHEGLEKTIHWYRQEKWL